MATTTTTVNVVIAVFPATFTSSSHPHLCLPRILHCHSLSLVSFHHHRFSSAASTIATGTSICYTTAASDTLCRITYFLHAAPTNPCVNVSAAPQTYHPLTPLQTAHSDPTHTPEFAGPNTIQLRNRMTRPRHPMDQSPLHVLPTILHIWTPIAKVGWIIPVPTSIPFKL